ncbi:MAG: YceI family protein [Chitinophagaceae bacterium]|nr:YceI family protein [Chitinophagaceae bacterium]MEA3425564.1 YceI family protein [Bacteroidota bacterium]MCA6454056.1 YceI family protein [Chitinophagaceae bacterium]MCA6456799.1 YceI family protein [Chitinophagaceae bacterium]MCA6460306.1 YceI family protein [Chitinophagaceae bacterium]
MNLVLQTTQKKVLTLGVSLLLFIGAFAQVKYSNKNAANLVVSGTSTLHDWDMKSAQGNCEATITLNAAGALTALNGLSFSTNALELKSGKGAMDKNAYKALKTDKSPNITYTAATSAVSASGTDYLVKTNGKLTIAGATLDAEITAICKVHPDKTITVTGSKKISMKDFGMVPPSFMMGTIKTGNDVTLKFDFTLGK